MTDLLLDIQFGFEDDAPGFDGRVAEAAPLQAVQPDTARVPVDTVHNAITAAEVQARFAAQRPRWFAGLQAETEGIARVLAEEARASAAQGGLPGVDHRSLWDSAGQGSGVSVPARKDMAAEWHPPLWAMAPVVRRQGGTLRLRLPTAATLEAVQREVLAHCPSAWRKRERVVVRIEIETRIY